MNDVLKMKIKLLFVSIFLINQAIAAEVEIAGSMTGQADVDSSGGLNYSIPISLPNSLHNFIPNLSLDYSGHKQEGSLGVGWSITGLSVISRCQGVDNEVARKKTTTEIVNYEMSLLGANTKAFEFSDFCLDGKRLILTNGQTVAQPEFRLENDDFSRVTLKTNQSGSIEKFVVTQKNGVIREYEKIITINEKNSSGQYVDKISGGSLPYIWGLTKQSDIQGNYWTVEYLDFKKTDILYPKYIKYTGNSNGLKPYNLVTFDYVDRAEYEKKVSYFDGSTIVLDKKLSKISLSVNGEVKNEYNLNYEEVGVKENKQISRVRLKDVNFCSIQTNEKSCVKPSEFTWSSYDKSNISEPVLSSAMSLSDGDVRKFIRLNSKKNSREQNLFVLMKNSNTNILVKIYQIINGLSSSKRELNLTHDSFNKFIEWQPIVKDVDNDEIDDLIIYGRDKDNNISLLEFTSFFDSDGNRQFKFYKEISNIYQVDMPLSQHLVIDGDRDGVDDFLFIYNDLLNNKLSFYVLKVDIDGNKSELFRNNISWDSLRYINDIRSPNYPARLVVGHFNSNEVLSGLIIHNNGKTSGEERICSFSIIGKNTYLNNDSQICNSNVLYTKENNLGLTWVHNEFVVVDYNQDGYDDLVRANIVRDGYGASKVNSESTKFWDELVPILSKGDGTFDVKNLIKTEPFFINTLGWTSLWVGKWTESSAFFGDYNQDGLLDYYRYADQGEKIYFVGFIQEPDNKFKSYNYSLDQWSYASDPDKIKLYTSLGVPLKLNLDSKDSGSFKLNFFAEPNLDYNSDGNPTLAFNVYATKSATGYLYSFKANIEPRSARTEPKDLLTLVSHGDTNKTGISYSNIFTTTELLNKNTFPIRSFTKPMLVVNTLNYGWGEGNISEINEFLYSSPKIDMKNGRNLGFESITQIKQGQQNLKVETTYNQNYPYIGMPKAIVTKAALNGASGGFDTLVSKMTAADADFVSDSAYPTTKVKFPRIKKSTVENYELGTLVSKTVTANNYENVFGNLTDSTVTTSSADGTSVFTTTVKPTYGTADKTNWIPGLIKDRVMTASRTGQTTIQTKTSYEYDTKRQVIKKIDEPDDAALKLQTDYSYDAYGNVTKVSVSGTGNGTDTGATRTVSSAYEAGTGYPAGVFKTKETNALSQQSTATYDAVTGQLLTSTDINGVASTQKIDALGRVIQTKSASGVQTDISYQLCKTFVEVGSNSSECEKGENYKITSTSTLNAPVITYKDANGNVKRTLTKAYDNVNNTVVRNEYTASGRLYRSSSPSLSNVAYANLQWTTYEYDALGRVSKLTEPGNRVTSYTRSGLQTTMTNAKNLKRTEKSNIANEVVEIVDHDNKSLKYSRDALGRITQTTDASGNTISLTLDKNGNKLQQVDPELGTWKYRYNVLGQPVWQQDGKGQQTTFQYDSLGRLIKRTEPDLTSTWTWDATNGKGQLAQVSSTNGFSESYSYDSYGRQIQTTTSKKIDPIAQGTTDPDFITKWNYDNAGRMLAFAYPTGFGYRNIYDTNGYLKEVRNLAGTQLYWSADARDARGNVTAETLGNGLETKRAYKADTGFIESISTGDAKIQQNTYSFDVLGNLTNRNQNLAGISVNETFSYDNINRLTSVVNQSGGKVTASYDAIGNLTAKSDTGTYNYATGGTSCGVHKVCTISSTTGGLNTAFSYDANGNLLSGNNRSYSWTSFNMPLQIKQGTTTESFMYDANHERVRRTSVENGKTTTTLYINPRIDTGGTFEKSYLPDGTAEYTHYLYAGGDVLGSYVSKDKGTPPTGDLGLTAQAGVAPNSAKAAVSKTGPYRYFHSDHLTSIEVITDATGAVVERLSYDPWGKRRNADGTVASTMLKGTKDSHGFTSHEMLDSIGLVHMNGRVYDPQVGRFTSADPTIDGADNLQGYNRYSYVHNNPGTLLDPSGYGFLSKLVREVVRPFKQIGHALEDAMITVTDDWLGSCSSSQGNCGVTVGVTYGPNNQGYYSTDNQNINQYNNGKMTIQPYVGFGGPKNYYFVNSSYQNGELNFNGVGYNSNGMVELVPEYRIHASYLSGFSQYLFNAAGTELGDFLTGMQRDQRQAIDENTPDQAETVVEASLLTTTVGRFPSFGFGRVGAGISRTWNKLFRPCGCFDDDTPVLTKDGYKRIVEIKEGDLVLARHEETGEIAYKPVKRVFVIPNRRIYLLKTIDGVGKENIIEVSDDHPFWVVDKKWVDSIDLKEGDQLLDANNQVHKVVSITETDRVETTYNLEVEGYHTYFAGDANVWVHNANCIFETTQAATKAAKKLGFQKTNEFSHGQAVYKKGKYYITPDIDGHNGGAWKMAKSVEKLASRETRLGTYDINLNRIGD